MAKKLPPSSDPFWFFVRGLLRYRALTLTSLVFVVFSSLSLSAGLLGATPVMDAILGNRQNLQGLALKLNESIVDKAPWLSFLKVRPWVIDVLPTDPFVSLTWKENAWPKAWIVR